MNETKLNCEIVRDLLPLYHDKVVSEATETAVSAHLSDCADCAMEFLKLKAELPEEKETAPKKKFADLLRTRRKYRILTMVTAVILLCGLLLGGFFLQAQLPVVPFHDDVVIERIYRYETEKEYKYFMIVTHPLYGGMQIKPEAQTLGDADTSLNILYLNFTKPLISFRFGTESRILFIDGGYETSPDGVIRMDYDLVNFGGDPVWSDAWSNEEVPEYVYAYDEMHETGGGCSLNLEENWIGICIADGEYRYWTLDGTPLETPPGTAE